MTIHFLPDQYTRATSADIAVPAERPSRDALTDPSDGHVVIPARVEIHLTRIEGTERGDRYHAYVAVIGPRRLKSGAVGKQITTVGWERSRNDGPRGYVDRPDWLTALLAEHLPAGWNPALLDLPTEMTWTAEHPPECGDSAHRHTGSCALYAREGQSGHPAHRAGER